MFVQIVSGSVTDRELFLREAARWEEEVRPGAAGYLGGLWGLSPDGTGVAVAEFESAAAAQANSDRPEQGEWWAAIEPAFAEVSFQDCAEVDVMEREGASAPGFVQIIRGRVKDQDATRRMMQQRRDDLFASRPDIVSGLMAWPGQDGTFTQVMCFRSEDEARSGESTMADDEVGRDYQDAMAEPPTFLDLPEPHLD